MHLAVASVLLAAVLAFAVVRPRGLPEATAAVPAALLVLVTGALSWHDAATECRRLASTVGFLAAVLVLSQLCDDEGLFAAAGRLMARAAHGSPRRLLGLVFAVAATVTAVLSLDATVVLLTPVVFATAARLRLRPTPHVYACAHLANTASLLLPVSNLTNLLAFAATGLSFVAFARLMVLPWLVAIAVEYVVLRRVFAADLAGTPAPPGAPPGAPLPAGPSSSAPPSGQSGSAAAVDGGAGGAPGFALVVVGATLVGFGLTSVVGIEPVWPAAAGALVLAARALATGRTRPVALAQAANAPFLLFVPALAVVVLAVTRHGLGTLVRHLLPTAPTLAGLLAAAALAAVLANLLNNLPAVLVLLPAATGSPGLVLAVLIGVNVGPNLTYVGSLATLLWRQVLRNRDAAPDLGAYLRLGAYTVPATLVAAVLALWAALRL